MNRKKRNVGHNSHGLYFHSSVPKVFPNIEDFGKINFEFSKSIASKANALVIKPSNIRIWIHDKDIDKLMKVILEGHGQKLRSEVSSNTKVKRFLEYVPHFMGLIKSIHQAVVDNNITLLQAKTSPPVPPQMLSSKDVNGLTPLHKAAGLGHTKIVEYLLETWSNAAQETDMSGKTPLHYAAACRNNERIFSLLLAAGADETAIDGRGRTPTFYKKAKNSDDLDKSWLTVIPDAPRISEQGFPSHFSWDSLPAKFYQAPLKFSQSELNLSRSPEINMKQSSSAFEILSKSDSDLNENAVEEEVVVQKIERMNNKRVKSSGKKKDLNNNTPKPTNDFEEMNDDDDVETVETAETETLLPDDRSFKQNGTNGYMHEENEQDRDDPNDTDNNLKENDEIDVNSNEINESNDDQPEGSELIENAEVGAEETANVEIEPEEVEPEKFENEAENIENEVEMLENEPENLINESEDFEDEPENLVDELENFEQEPDETMEKEEESPGENDPEPEKEDSVEPEIENQEDPSQEMENIEPTIEETEFQSVTSDGEEQTIVNNENNDSAYETNGADNASRIQSSDTNENNENVDIDAENIEAFDENNVDILVINREDENSSEEVATLENEAPMEENLEDVIAKAQELNEIDGDDDDDVVVSADNTRETGDSTIANNHNEEPMDDEDDSSMGQSEDEIENDIGSPSPPFEGIVREEPEKQNESQGREFENRDEENGEINEPFKAEDDVQKIINSGDMEQLAILVLNGDGKQLIGRTSNQPDIQAFLDNVPIYMGKIHKVHAAAREGSLRDLQAALDRRKFSTARDESSPNGTTPLHVAITFGHTAIIRYLGSRFPETLSATDDENRTALHYAATIKDNGHFYNLLVTLGANPKAVDNFGQTAEFYLNHEESEKILSHKDLLRSFGASEELADEMLNDQEYKSNEPVEIPLFRTEEGRYLATSLGDPLIKGLTEVANLRPTDPIGFLANYLQNFSTDGRKTASKKVATPKIKTPHNHHHTANHHQEVKAEPLETITENHVKPNPAKTATIRTAPREKPVESLIDDHIDEHDVTPGMDERDEHGQSMLHFAAARQHGKNALFQLIEESGVSLTYRDEIYRTARDVSLQASQPDNCKEIDRYVLSLAARGDYETFVSMVLDGYDHIVDITDNDGAAIEQVARARGHQELATYLEQVRDFEEHREKLLFAIRHDDIDTVKEILSRIDAAKLARAKNYYGRCSLHVAVLVENEEIVEYIATNFRQTLKVGDNLERTALHYSMGINNVEAISRILIKMGAKRVLKDLKGRTASFYYINKGDIARLQEEEKL